MKNNINDWKIIILPANVPFRALKKKTKMVISFRFASMNFLMHNYFMLLVYTNDSWLKSLNFQEMSDISQKKIWQTFKMSNFLNIYLLVFDLFYWFLALCRFQFWLIFFSKNLNFCIFFNNTIFFFFNSLKITEFFHIFGKNNYITIFSSNEIINN